MDNAVERAKDLFINQILTTSFDTEQPNKQTQLSRTTKANISRVKNSLDERRRRDKWEVVENSSSRTSESSCDSRVSSNTSHKPKYLENEIIDNTKCIQSPNVIKIEVLALELSANTSFTQQDNSRLHVEYTFMGQFFETQSLGMPTKGSSSIIFNFVQKFKFKNDDDKRMKRLKAIIAKNSNEKLKFLVVKKLLGSECEEIGFAFIKLSNSISGDSGDSAIFKLDVYSTDYPHDLIASLVINISGILFLTNLSKQA